MERAHKRGPRRSLLSLCLGIGALTVALLARLLAHKPRCPGPLAKQRPSLATKFLPRAALQMRPEGKWPELRVSSVKLGVDVKLSL